MKKPSKQKAAKHPPKANKKERKQKRSITAVEQQVEQNQSVQDPVPELADEELAPVLDGYDEASLSRAKTHWLFGEWQTLAGLDLKALRNHPDRDRFALLAASAHQQLGSHDKARKYTRMAIDWGCPPRVVAQILIAGVHNTLGKAAALKQDESRIAQHFKASVTAIGTRDAALVSHARSVREMARMGLLPQAVSLVDKELQVSQSSRHRPEQQQARIQHLQTEMNSLRKNVYKERLGISSRFGASAGPGSGWLSDSVSEKHVIIVAGMRHSGSTALFNIIRLTLEALELEYISCYSEHNDCVTNVLDHKNNYLVKTHELRDDLLSIASIIFTARRDLRDAVASAKRRGFHTFKTIGGAVEYAKYNRGLHDLWQPYSDYEFIYEEFMREPSVVINTVLQVLGAETVDQNKIYDNLIRLPTDRYEETLLSPTHITDPDRALSFSDTLDEAVVDKIELQHRNWLDRYGYKTRLSIKSTSDSIAPIRVEDQK